MPDFSHEQQIFNQGYSLLGAIDEAGRGPLAGPVVAACVVVDMEFKPERELLDTIKDSKKLSEKKREELFDIIHELFNEVGVGICDHTTIDRINILEASFLAMKKAVGCLKYKPSFIMLDGKFKIPNFSLNQQAIIRGDERSISIAAASIIAKVTRDRIMRALHDYHPEYGFNQHKGYGTKLHLENLYQHGPCAIHRTSFKPVRNTNNKNKN